MPIMFRPPRTSRGPTCIPSAVLLKKSACRGNTNCSVTSYFTVQISAIPVRPVSDALVAMTVMATGITSLVTTSAFELIFQITG